MRKSILVILSLASALGFASAQAPDFTVTDSGGKTHQLYADYVSKGKVVVLEVFFINCPPCATHAPHVQGLYQQMKTEYGDRVEFLLFSDKSADTNPLVAQYRSSKSLTMPAVGSDGGSVTAVQPYKSGQFGPYFGTPTFVVIAPGTGQVFYDIRGNNAAGTMQLIRQKIAELLPVCRIFTPDGDTLQTYSLTLSVPGGGTSSKFAVTNGAYTLEAFPGLPALPFYEAVPAKNNNPLNGVSTFDLVLMNRQILGIEPFQHPWQFLAADANNSNSVSTIDIVEFRKLILGIYDTLPQAPSWVFSPAMDSLWPQQCSEFLAIKKGDVNANADPKNLLATDDRNADPWPLHLENRHLNAGQAHTVRLFAGKGGQWTGFQAAFQYDTRALQILSLRSEALPGFDENAWRVSDGRLVLSWLAQGDPVEVHGRDIVLEIEVLALRDCSPQTCLLPEEAPLRAEVYSAEGGVHPVEIRKEREQAFDAAISPNPAHGQFSLRLERASSGQIPLQLIDVQGRIVFETTLSFDAGTNRFDIAPGILANGVYAVRAGGEVVGRLIWEGQ